jgi:transmembrane sensor
VSGTHQPADELHAIRETAAGWVVRRDRGLSSREAIEFELWHAADPRHAAAMKAVSTAWSMFDRVSEAKAQPMLAAAVRRRTWWYGLTLAGLAAAAALVVATTGWWRTVETIAPSKTATVPVAALTAAGPRSVELADGSLLRLNSGGEVVEEFTAAERRVRLTRGEAHFTVTENPSRPFIVTAGALEVRAVGTAFNVNLQSSQVEVLVTDGRVRVTSEDAPSSPEVVAGERAVLPTLPADDAAAGRTIVVTRVDPAAMTRALAWQGSVVRLGGSTLGDLAVEFERRSGQRVKFADPELAQLRVGGRLRGDDIDGFANLLATTFDLEVERASDGALVLRKKNAVSR